MNIKKAFANYYWIIFFVAAAILIEDILSAYTHPLLISYPLNFFSTAFFALTIFTVWVIASYSKNYLTGEEGILRFWILFLIFTIGLIICSFSLNLESFFIGWELVGLASFFLIGFYQNNARSIENSFLALANYKSCDVFFILAIFLEGSSMKTLAGFCLILATLAKSAQFPFSSWLYKSLEGPTPSSTAFYGGLSLHLGPFLLLQFCRLWDHSPGLRILLGCIGGISMIYGFLVGSSRSDVKTSFAFASISQVGIIYIELALGFYHLAMIHLIGHNLLRTWTYLRANSFFGDFLRRDYHLRANFIDRLLTKLPQSIYFHAFNSFYMDQIFIKLRTTMLFVYLGFLLKYIFTHFLTHDQTLWGFLFLFISNALSIYCFVDEKIKLTLKSTMLVISQILILGSIDLLNWHHFNYTYFTISLLSIGGILYAFAPAIKIWKKHSVHSGEYFLGLKKLHFNRYVIFLICALSISAVPGSIQFLYQEETTLELWKVSHSFAVFSLIAMAFNSYHFLKLGLHAFLGEENNLIA